MARFGHVREPEHSELFGSPAEPVTTRRNERPVLSSSVVSGDAVLQGVPVVRGTSSTLNHSPEPATVASSESGTRAHTRAAPAPRLLTGACVPAGESCMFWGAVPVVHFVSSWGRSRTGG